MHVSMPSATSPSKVGQIILERPTSLGMRSTIRWRRAASERMAAATAVPE
jgi:hypothetical protein